MKISMKAVYNELFCAPHESLSHRQEVHVCLSCRNSEKRPVVPDNPGIVTLRSRLLSVLSLHV